MFHNINNHVLYLHWRDLEMIWWHGNFAFHYQDDETHDQEEQHLLSNDWFETSH